MVVSDLPAVINETVSTTHSSQLSALPLDIATQHSHQNNETSAYLNTFLGLQLAKQITPTRGADSNLGHSCSV